VLLLSFASAAAAEVKSVLLYLLARLGVDDHLPCRHPTIVAGAGTPASIGREHADGQDVFAVLVAAQEVGTVAGLFAVVDRVRALPRAAGHEVEILAGEADFVSTGAVELGVSLLSGSWVRRVRGRLIHVNLLSRLAGLREVRTPRGHFYV
jgi:hypothetical protein